MKKLASIALSLVMVTFTLSGCVRSRLLQVERIMESDVEIADSLFFSMNEPSGKRNNALYSLLRTQIDYKMYRDAVSDSIIRIATDYYGKRYKDYHAAMAWYSLGCISAELGQDSTAADAYLTAMRLFPDTLVRYYALAEQNLSYIYLDHKMNSEALLLIRSCRANAVRLRDSMAIAFCDFNIARSLLIANEYDTACAMFMRLKDSEWMSPSTKNIPLLELSKIAQYRDSDYEEALKYIDLFFVKNEHYKSTGAAYTIKADILKGLNQLDSALYYYKLSFTDLDDPYTICNSCRNLAELYSIKGNQDSATFYAKLVGEWADTIVSISKPEIILRALLNNSQSIPQPKSKKRTFFIVLVIVICLSTLSILSLRYYKIKHKAPQCIADFAHDIEEFKNSDLYHKMINVIHAQTSLSGKECTVMEKEFRESLSGLRKFIVSSTSRLTGMELDYCIFTLVGFKQRDFHLFYSISYSGSRKFKARIKDRMPENVFNDIFGAEKVLMDISSINNS